MQLILYDVTSSFYTGTHCPLVASGHPRDGKNEYTHILYGLLCNAAGCFTSSLGGKDSAL